jgi:serine/threonine protein phosphatase PrpC
LVAAIADGVGQSYRGDIAAMAVVQSLLDTLWHMKYTDQRAVYDATVTTQLQSLAERVTQVIQDIDISYHATMFRDALEKRRRLGSESMFIAIRADVEHDQLYVCWLGDCRLRLLLHTESEHVWPNDAFDTMQRWSSVRLLVGDVHAAVIPLSHIKCILMYSDGLHLLDTRPLQDIINLDTVREATRLSQTVPASDDVTCVCVHVHHTR